MQRPRRVRLKKCSPRDFVLQVLHKTKSPSMLDLPTDLSVSILTEWLADLKSIVALDSAVAISVRADYLTLIAHPTFVLRLAGAQERSRPYSEADYLDK